MNYVEYLLNYTIR